MKKYFLHNGSENIGPFDLEELKAKNINKETPVWCEGMTDWTTAGEIEELKSMLVTVPPPITRNEPQVIKTGKAKKSKTLKYILIGFAAIAVVFSGIVIYTMNENNSNDSFDNIAPEEAIDSEASDEIDYRKVRNAIEEKVTVTTNQYSYDPLGGISNLDVTVTNNTNYRIDIVTVAVDYMKDAGGVYKTEYITLKNIPARQDKTASAPDSDRGTSVQVKPITINSKALQLCYDGTVAPAVGDPDPYYCD